MQYEDPCNSSSVVEARVENSDIGSIVHIVNSVVHDDPDIVDNVLAGVHNIACNSGVDNSDCK